MKLQNGVGRLGLSKLALKYGVTPQRERFTHGGLANTEVADGVELAIDGPCKEPILATQLLPADALPAAKRCVLSNGHGVSKALSERLKELYGLATAI